MDSKHNFYFRFRRMSVTGDSIIGLTIFDFSNPVRVNESTPLFLRAAGVVVATNRPIEKATYPALLPSGDIRPAAYIEVKWSTVERLLSQRSGIPESGVLQFDCVDAEGHQLSDASVFGLPMNVHYPVPDRDNTKRVAGVVPPEGFVVSGASWYAAFRSLLEKELEGPATPLRILDWGVGCGRIARYFLHEGQHDIYGIDIDQYNIDWCARHLAERRFTRCDFDPPIEFGDNTFDAIYGHSVFTHLDEDAEALWLSELNRVLKPGGIACCTVNTEFGAYQLYNRVLRDAQDMLSPLWNEGRQDFGAMSVGVDKGRRDYYRLIAHSRRYLTNVWPRFVDVQKIIPGFADTQDGVVFRKRFEVSPSP